MSLSSCHRMIGGPGKRVSSNLREVALRWDVIYAFICHLSTVHFFPFFFFRWDLRYDFVVIRFFLFFERYSLSLPAFVVCRLTISFEQSYGDFEISLMKMFIVRCIYQRRCCVASAFFLPCVFALQETIYFDRGSERLDSWVGERKRNSCGSICFRGRCVTLLGAQDVCALAVVGR